MSHTDKDVPYWVRLNNDGTKTRHNHLDFGKPITKRVYLYDENDQPVMREEDIVRRAVYIVNPDRIVYWWLSNGPIGDEYRTATGAWPEPVRREAHRLVNAGRGNEYVKTGTRMVHVYETVITGYIKDYCTAGEKLPDRDDRELPCVPQIPAEAPWWAYTPSGARQTEHEGYYGQQRTNARRAQREQIKAWNSGADLIDWDEEEAEFAYGKRMYMFW